MSLVGQAFQFLSRAYLIYLAATYFFPASGMSRVAKHMLMSFTQARARRRRRPWVHSAGGARARWVPRPTCFSMALCW